MIAYTKIAGHQKHSVTVHYFYFSWSMTHIEIYAWEIYNIVF